MAPVLAAATPSFPTEAHGGNSSLLAHPSGPWQGLKLKAKMAESFSETVQN